MSLHLSKYHIVGNHMPRLNFNRSSLYFETAFTLFLYFQPVDDNTLTFSAERWQAFFEKLILVFTMLCARYVIRHHVSPGELFFITQYARLHNGKQNSCCYPFAWLS